MQVNAHGATPQQPGASHKRLRQPGVGQVAFHEVAPLEGDALRADVSKEAPLKAAVLKLDATKLLANEVLHLKGLAANGAVVACGYGVEQAAHASPRTRCSKRPFS